jgi:hypothetical protein
MGNLESKNSLLYHFIFKDKTANSQTRVLAFITWRARENPITKQLECTDAQVYIANWLQMDRSDVSKVVTILEEKGYFQREVMFTHNANVKKYILPKHWKYEDINQLHKDRAIQLGLVNNPTSVGEIPNNTDQQALENIPTDNGDNTKTNSDNSHTNKDSKDSININKDSFKESNKKNELEEANKKNERARNKLLKRGVN